MLLLKRRNGNGRDKAEGIYFDVASEARSCLVILVNFCAEILPTQPHGTVTVAGNPPTRNVVMYIERKAKEGVGLSHE